MTIRPLMKYGLLSIVLKFEELGNMHKEIKINRNVPLNDRGQNANIKFGNVPDDTLKSFGFWNTEDSWYMDVVVCSEMDITFNISIVKSTKEVIIDVLDEEFLQPYDYQEMLGLNGIANEVHYKVQDCMKSLVDSGIIVGYNMGDYI